MIVLSNKDLCPLSWNIFVRRPQNLKTISYVFVLCYYWVNVKTRVWFFHFFFAFSENLNFIFLFFQAQEPRPGPSISKEASEESKTDSSSEMDNVYHVKWIGWNSKKTPIITQNSNGPCPMLAITNVLLLKGKISLPEGCEVVSSEQLLENLGVYLFIKVCSHWWNMWWVHSRKYPKNLNKIYYFVK